MTTLESWAFLSAIFLAAYLVVVVIGLLRTLRNEAQEPCRESYWENPEDRKVQL